MSYSGYQYTTGQPGYNQPTPGTDMASYSQSQQVYDSTAQYSVPDQANQFTSGPNSASYDYSYPTEYYSQNQASQPSDYNQQSQMVYSQPPASTPDSYYSYNVNTAQPQHSQQSMAPAQTYHSSGEGQVSSYAGVQPVSGYDIQYQQAPQQQQQQQLYQTAPQQQQPQQQYQPVSHSHQQQLYQEQSHAQPQYQAPQPQGYENTAHSTEVYGVANPSHPGMGGYSNTNNLSEGTWAADSHYVEPTIYYQSETPASDKDYQQGGAGYSNSIDPGVDNMGGFPSYTDNGGSFSSYTDNNFPPSSNQGYMNDGPRPRTNPSEINKTEYGGYSGPAPSARGSWRRPMENARGGMRGGTTARGRSSFHQDSKGSSFGSRTGGTWAAPQQRRNEYGGNWRGGGNQSRRQADFQSGPSYGARKKFDGIDNQNRGQEGHQGFNRGGGFSFSSSRGRMQQPAYAPPPSARPVVDDTPAFETQRPYKRPENIKAPSRPQDRLLNEVQEKAKAAEKKKASPEEMKKMEEERKKAEAEAKKKAEENRKKAEEERKKAEEEAKKRAEEERIKAEEEKKKAAEELRKKLADEAVKAAPPSKPPETAEEIAYEEEIQRKIRESVVVLTSAVEEPQAPSKGDPVEELEMSEELRELLKSLTTQYLCKLCSVRIVGPQMAGMHYNGKNHLKKLRNFVQTNGRSAGFYLGVEEQKAKDTKDDEEQDGENKAEAVETTEVDEKKYCKICKVSFSQPSQAEMHYKGKNHAKKLKACGGADGTGPEVFECKICCVTVTAQEHLTAHLNGARHKLQVRKIDANENYSGSVPNRGRGGLGYRGRGGRGGGSDWKPVSEGGRGGIRGRGRGEFRGRGGHDQAKKDCLINYTDEELLNLFSIEPSKKFCFDLANYRTPSGSLYCSSCDVAMTEEPQFLLHLGSKKHREKVLGKKKKLRKGAFNYALKDSMNISRRD